MPRVEVEQKTLDDLRAKLSQDAYTAVEAARMVSEIEKAAVSDTRIIVTVYDKFYRPVGEAGDYLSVECKFPRNQVESGNLSLKRTDPLADVVLQCHETTVPVTIEIGHLLWSGQVKTAHDNFNNAGQADFVECELEGDYAWLMKILAWPNFLLPLQVQFPPRGVAIGPAISILKWLLGTQAFRLQAGMWEMVNNLLSLNLDWRAWFGTVLSADPGSDGIGLDDVARTLRTPIYVVPTNPLTDTSPFISVNWRMDKIGSIFEEVVEDNGLHVEVKLWRPGDPQPGNDPLLALFPLTVPTIVVDIKDRMGIVGPTGTFLDGILRVLVDLQSSIFGDVLAPFLNPKGEYAPDGWNIAPLLGVHYVPTWAVFNADHPKGGVSGRLSHHRPEAWRVIVGGKSPKWLNDLINATMAFILDMVLIVVGITGIPSNMFEGLFNDVLLAFQLADNFDRRVKMGPYGHAEVFVPTNKAPYTIDGIFALKREMWNTRGYISGEVTFKNGLPYEIGRDLFPGALATIIRNGQLYTDWVENIVVVDTRDGRSEVIVQIGDGKAEEAPVVKLQRKLSKFQEAINILTLATQ
ncbi:minor tail protein [Mycobacterium phage Omega]|uniref:Minor tail protein n=1 Tax=Mycobacterium phage Omega TaxID=2907835 RepID=Q854M8_BPMOM|nr:minor tail protein [Mycobacterium phage Omega]AAN12680.1 minor tail protein [Mycobacterium phage Omega]